MRDDAEVPKFDVNDFQKGFATFLAQKAKNDKRKPNGGNAENHTVNSDEAIKAFEISLPEHDEDKFVLKFSDICSNSKPLMKHTQNQSNNGDSSTSAIPDLNPPEEASKAECEAQPDIVSPAVNEAIADALRPYEERLKRLEEQMAARSPSPPSKGQETESKCKDDKPCDSCKHVHSVHSELPEVRRGRSGKSKTKKATKTKHKPEGKSKGGKKPRIASQKTKKKKK